MANLHNQTRRGVDEMAEELETYIEGNRSAEVYMKELHAYLKQLSIIRTWPRPKDDVISVQLDENDGVAWVALIPILYFITVALIMGVLVGYFWYYTTWTINAELDQTSDLAAATSVTIRSCNRINLNGAIAKPGANNADNNNIIIDGGNIFVRSNETAVESIIRASIASRGSVRSVNIIPNINEYLLADRGTSVCSRNLLDLSRVHQQRHEDNSETSIYYSSKENSHNRQYPINVSVGSRSFYSNESYEHDDNDDIVSRDSLRTSMESQKLLATGVNELAPDDFYSLSDNAAYYSDDNTIEHKARRTASFHLELSTSGIDF